MEIKQIWQARTQQQQRPNAAPQKSKYGKMGKSLNQDSEYMSDYHIMFYFFSMLEISQNEIKFKILKILMQEI